MPNRFTWRCCCCGIFSDKFTRASSTDLGTDWTEVAGDWSIVNQALSVATANAVARCETPQPDGQAIYAITVKVKATAVGDRLRVIVDYVDSDNYYFAELQIATSSSVTLRLLSRIGGTNTQLASISYTDAIVGVYRSLQVCLGGGVISADVLNVNARHVAAPRTGTSPYFGLGTGAMTGTASFDDLVVTRHWLDSEPCTRCPTYCPGCKSSGVASQKYLATFAGINGPAGATGYCPDRNGSFELPLVEVIAGSFCRFELNLHGVLAPGDIWLVSFRFLFGPPSSVLAINGSGPGTFSTDARFTRTLAGADCLAFDELDIPFNNGISFFGGSCTSGPPTCKITAL